MLTWALLLLLAASTQAQSAQPLEVFNHLLAATGSPSPTPSSNQKAQAGRSPPEIPLLKPDVATVQRFRSTDDKPINANNFRQPLAPASGNTAVRAPSPQSTEPSELSALTSARLLRDWEVEDLILLATIDGTIHARDRKTGQERWSLGIPESPMIETIHHRLMNVSDPDEGEDDYIFIVEPSQDGNLYLQHKDPSIGLQRLRATVKSLSAHTPQLVNEPPLVTLAKQETKLYTVDAATGEVLQQFPRHTDFVNDDKRKSCRRLSGFELDSASCDPIGTLTLGRVHYTITLSHAVTTNLICTIKYAEWLPNKADEDLQSQYVEPLDNYIIQTHHSGRFVAVDTSDASKSTKYDGKLDAPVAQVFDVVRPMDNKDEQARLVLLARPSISPRLLSAPGWADDLQNDRVFVNRTEAGNWYAMSELCYPGVTGHTDLAMVHHRFDNSPLDLAEDSNQLVGVHLLSSNHGSRTVRLTISGPESITPMQSDLIDASLEPMHLSQPQSYLPSDVGGWGTIFTSIVFFAILFSTVGLKMRHRLMLKVQRNLRKLGLPVTTEKINPDMAAEPLTTEVETLQEIVPNEIEDPSAAGVRIEEPPVIATPPRSRAATVQSMATSTARTVRIQESNDNSSDGESDDEKVKDEQSSTGGAESTKRRHRGKRGGKKNNKKKKSMSPEALDQDQALVPEISTKDGLLQVGEIKYSKTKCLGRGSNGTEVFPGTYHGRDVAVKRLIRSVNSLAAKEIKHLLSNDDNPHVIKYFGKAESENFTYIALELFTTSLDKFIEYPADYPELVTMAEGFNVKDCLIQITKGLQHLHNLKLVHRDIKPQNVLVKAGNNRRPEKPLELRFVISDFGLCKPLEDGPESTFAPTANHTAAGTTGWRAPELLVNARAAVAAPQACSSTSKSSTLHSNDGTVIDIPSGRRATKAIDIFSLGCVFYYIMTQGLHPFDVGGTSLGRDLNIKENRFTTTGLRLHSYSFEADDLVMQMLHHNPRQRPDTTTILRHPYFWDAALKLDFLCEVSDNYEAVKNSVSNIHDPNAPRTAAEEDALEELAALEALAPNVISGRDFLKALPRSFINEMGKQRKYSGHKVIDLLRVIRNKKNHMKDLPEDVKDMMMGGTPEGYFVFWAKRFPSLLMNCHCVILERHLMEKFQLRRFYDDYGPR